MDSAPVPKVWFSEELRRKIRNATAGLIRVTLIIAPPWDEEHRPNGMKGGPKIFFDVCSALILKNFVLKEGRGLETRRL